MITLNFDPAHRSTDENWGIDQNGFGWGWFSGTIERQCAECGARIVSGWANWNGDLTVSRNLCREHVDDSAIFNKPKPPFVGVKL